MEAGDELDSDEIISLVNEHGSAIYNFCLYLAKNKQDGEDLFQQTFLRTMEISSRIDKHKNPKSYLLSIAVNTWKNTIQKRTRRNRLAPTVDIDCGEAGLLQDHNADIESKVIGKITREALLGVINKLDDKHRVPVILFYSENMKISEISALLHKPEGTVKRLMHEAKKRIKKEMETMGYE